MAKKQHCMNCGGKLKTTGYDGRVTEFICTDCNTKWHKVTRTIVEWVEVRL